MSHTAAKTEPDPGTDFFTEIAAADAWAGRLRQLGPAAPRPELREVARVEFCAGFLAASKARH
jgi:hypothetical protein